MEPAPEVFANFNINAVNASYQDIIKDNVEDNSVQIRHSQLNPLMFMPITPIKANRLEAMLKGHPNRNLVNYVVNVLSRDFCLNTNVQD